jgi:hypothetical protein
VERSIPDADIPINSSRYGKAYHYASSGDAIGKNGMRNTTFHVGNVFTLKESPWWGLVIHYKDLEWPGTGSNRRPSDFPSVAVASLCSTVLHGASL